MKAVLGALTSVILMLDLVTGLPASNITPDLAKRLAEADAAADAAVPGAPGVGMKWTGEVFPGKEYELWGDAQVNSPTPISLPHTYKVSSLSSPRFTRSTQSMLPTIL